MQIKPRQKRRGFFIPAGKPAKHLIMRPGHEGPAGAATVFLFI
jgi:hypothetical protein